MLGYGAEPPAPWRQCCWENGNSCVCGEISCEFSWLSPVMPNRLVGLIQELATMYVNRGVVGVELNFMRAQDYFPIRTPQRTRTAVMQAFLRQVRQAMDAATTALGQPQLALGLQLSPDWNNIRAQGLGEIAKLVEPATSGGCGVTYLNWAVVSRSVYPFDTQLASLVDATPPGTPYYFQIQSWTHNGPAPGTPGSNASLDCDVKVRITKEELWTTALVARAYGARGLAAFNFIYTRYYSDGGCELAAGVPYSEPLFGALGQTRDDEFLSTADQFYRLSANLNAMPGQLGHDGASLFSSKNDFGLELRMFMVEPAGGWRRPGRLRLRTRLGLSGTERLEVALNGVMLASQRNTSSLFPTGVQAILSHYPAELWQAWDVPVACLRPGNNSIQIALRNSGNDAAVTHLDVGLPVGTGALKADDSSLSRHFTSRHPGTSLHGALRRPPPGPSSVLQAPSPQCPKELARQVNETGLLPVDFFLSEGVDDAQATRLAINASAVCGGAVFFRATRGDGLSRYTFSSTVDLPADIGLQGGGGVHAIAQFQTAPMAEIVGPRAGPVFNIISSGKVHLANLRIIGIHTGIYISDSALIRLTNVNVQATTVAPGRDNVNTTMGGCHGCNFVAGSNNTGMVVENSYWIFAEDCSFAFIGPGGGSGPGYPYNSGQRPAVILRGNTKGRTQGITTVYLLHFSRIVLSGGGVQYQQLVKGDQWPGFCEREILPKHASSLTLVCWFGR